MDQFTRVKLTSSMPSLALMLRACDVLNSEQMSTIVFVIRFIGTYFELETKRDLCETDYYSCYVGIEILCSHWDSLLNLLLYEATVV